MYKLGNSSKQKLIGVHPTLVGIVERAIQITKQDFAVSEGLRTKTRQAQLVKSGASKTMKSRHLTGHAVDLVPWNDGKADWENEKAFHEVAEAMRLAAIEKGVELLWGRAWHLALNYSDSAEAAFNGYLADCKTRKKRPFLDGPHFQLTWRSYP